MTESPENQTRRSCDSAAGSGAMMQVIEALDRASLALSASHNLTVTDRPDLPRDQWPVWVLDNAEALEAIETARRALGMDDEESVRVSVIEDVLD